VQTAELAPDLAAARAGLSAQLQVDRARGEVRVRLPRRWRRAARIELDFLHGLQCRPRPARAPAAARWRLGRRTRARCRQPLARGAGRSAAAAGAWSARCRAARRCRCNRPGAAVNARLQALGACAHCGEAFAGEGEYCCRRLRRAAEWIRSAGLADYYRLRSEAGNRVQAGAVDLRAWDREDVQRQHARVEGGEREIRLAVEACAAPPAPG
jgi:hypothetical protein